MEFGDSRGAILRMAWSVDVDLVVTNRDSMDSVAGSELSNVSNAKPDDEVSTPRDSTWRDAGAWCR